LKTIAATMPGSLPIAKRVRFAQHYPKQRRHHVNFSQPVPELPVSDLATAVSIMESDFGFSRAWQIDEARLAGMACGATSLFLREASKVILPITLWFYCENVDAVFETLKTRGAKTIAAPEKKPWGLYQFTALGPDGHLLHFHRD